MASKTERTVVTVAGLVRGIDRVLRRPPSARTGRNRGCEARFDLVARGLVVRAFVGIVQFARQQAR
jgi:hypothetical protein